MQARLLGGPAHNWVYEVADGSRHVHLDRAGSDVRRWDVDGPLILTVKPLTYVHVGSGNFYPSTVRIFRNRRVLNHEHPTIRLPKEDSERRAAIAEFADGLLWQMMEEAARDGVELDPETMFFEEFSQWRNRFLEVIVATKWQDNE